MSKMREAWLVECMKFNLDPDYNPVWRAKFEAGYQAAIAAVKEGGAIVWQNTRNGFICKERSAEYQHPLYKLPEN